MIKYSQNNPLYKNFKLGSSDLKVGDYGCTTSCVSTLCSYFGEEKTPGELARIKKLYTPSGLIIWNQVGNIYKDVKFFWRYYQFDEKVADDALLKDPNKAIMFQVNNRTHWVSALKKNPGSYVCSNPFPFPAQNKTYKHEWITGMAVLIRK